MKKCNICGKEVKQLAKGTHVFPVWILKTTFGERYAEIMHRITGLETPLPHLGREVDPKIYEDILNHNPSNDELDKIKVNNKLVIDDYWCKSCEDRITLVENYFQFNIENTLLGKAHDSNDLSIRSFPNLNSDYVKLFIYSIVYRASLINFSNFYLEPDYDNYLRKILHESLPLHKSDLTRGDKIMDYEPDNLSLLILRAEQIGQQRINPVLIHRENKNLVVFIVNQYVIILSDKNIDISIFKSDIFGLRSIIIENVEELRLTREKLNVGIIPNSMWIIIIDNISKWVNEIQQNNLIAIFHACFVLVTGKKPSLEHYDCFKNELVKEDIDDQRFSEKRIFNAFKESIEISIAKASLS